MSTAFAPKKVSSNLKGKSTEPVSGKSKIETGTITGKVVDATPAKGAAPAQKYYRPTGKKK